MPTTETNQATENKRYLLASSFFNRNKEALENKYPINKLAKAEYKTCKNLSHHD